MPVEMEQGVPPSNLEAVEETGAPAPPQGQQASQMDPKVQKQVESYSSGLLKLIYSKGTKGQVMNMLKSGDPLEAIPRTAMVINKQMETAIKKKGQVPSLEVRFASGVLLVNELMTLTSAGGFGGKQEFSEEESQEILKRSLQMYIEDGLKNRTLDPIELQQAVEPFLSDEQRAAGMQIAQQKGLPEKPGVHAAMSMYADQRVQQERAKMPKQGPQSMLQQQGGMR